MSGSNEKIVYTKRTCDSLYIPSIPSGLYTFNEGQTIAEPFTESRLTHMLEEFIYLGKVSRIDFVEKEGRGRSAFVHFEKWNDHENVDIFCHILNTEGSVIFSHIDEWAKGNVKDIRKNINFGTLHNGKRRNFNLIFKINHSPIPEADGALNIHQLTAANLFLENKVKELEKVKSIAIPKLYELKRMLAVYMFMAGHNTFNKVPVFMGWKEDIGSEFEDSHLRYKLACPEGTPKYASIDVEYGLEDWEMPQQK